jgi:tyrosyl-tRNA synthetase
MSETKIEKLINELQWRGLLHQKTSNIENLKDNVVAYVGFDPTSDSLHIGNLAPIMMMTHCVKSGARAIGLVGGATGMIGDPSGKKSERKFLDEQTLNYNFDCITKQLSGLLPPSPEESTYIPTTINNYDWYKNMSILDFLRNVGKHMSVNVMMTKDSVRNRIKPDETGEAVEGISFTEFTYQLIQAKDFAHLNNIYGCNLQMGGSDQWGNMTAGTELIRKTTGSQTHAITCPLITKSDGAKFGKSEKGNVWLDSNKTTPFEFYQYWINLSDEDAEKMIKVFTLLSREIIEDLIAKHTAAPYKRELQKILAKEVTTFVHGEDGYNEALAATNILFGKSSLDQISSLNKNQFERIFSAVPVTKINRIVYDQSASIISLLTEDSKFEIFKSKSDIRRLIKDNAISVNLEKIDMQNKVDKLRLLHDKYLIIKKGKKNYHLINVY